MAFCVYKSSTFKFFYHITDTTPLCSYSWPVKKLTPLVLILFFQTYKLGADCGPNGLAPTRALREGYLADSMRELENQFKMIYHDTRRLKGRVYQENGFKALIAGTVQEIPTAFLRALESHIETALKRGYADYAIYADMGHVHLLMPIGQDLDLNSPHLKLLYHTAELLRLKDGSLISGTVRTDPWLAWRYHSRNFVGTIKSPQELSVLFAQGQSYNTVRKLEGYQQVATAYFSSNIDGCFSYRFKSDSYKFDLAFE